jgi:Methyltransferase domain
VSLRQSLASLRVSAPVNQLRYHAYRDVLLAFPHRRQCNMCGWQGRRFLRFGHLAVLCPKCGSMVRHRLIAAAIQGCADLRDVLRPDGALLHVSPEYCIRRFVEPRVREYVRAEYLTQDCDIHLDLTGMPEIPDRRFDVIIACDVLEHITNDAAAFRECWRVLRPGGTAIFTVPQADADVATYEDAAKVTREQRTSAFGQEDHVRLYGNDFGRRLESAGFTITVVDASAFAPDIVRRNVLVPPVPNPPPFDFNWRRIFFARK